MGFRCPRCKADFGTDEAAFKKHLNENDACGVLAGSYIQLAKVGGYLPETALKVIKEHDSEATAPRRG